MVSAVSLVRKNRWHQMFWCTLFIKIVCTFFSSEPCECFTKSLSSFLVDSHLHLESLLLCISYSYIPSDCSGLCMCSCVFPTSVSIAFYIFFSDTSLSSISNKTCANHMCLCFCWWHAPMFLWKLVLFFRKLNYSNLEEHCLWQLAVIYFI